MFGPSAPGVSFRSVSPRTDARERSTAPTKDCAKQLFQITHPYHPLFQQEFELVQYHRNWGEDRVYFHDQDGALHSVPTGWTDAADIDPFVVMAAGRCPYRLEDLLVLAELAEHLKPARGKVRAKAKRT